MRINEWIVEMYGCTGELNDPRALDRAMIAGAEAVGSKVVQSNHYSFTPHGLTAAIILAESHMMISTWPENSYAVLEILLCNEEMDQEICLEHVNRVTRPEKVMIHKIPLQIAPVPKDATLCRQA